MKFNEEVEMISKSAGLSLNVVEVKDELKPTLDDIEELDKKILVRTEENRNMLNLSEVYAKNSMPCNSINKSYVVISDSYANNNTLDIYIKFLSNLNDNDIYLSELLKKYKNKDCNNEEYNIVLCFMKNNSLKSFVRNRVSDEERNRACRFINDLLNKSRESINEYIELLENNYNELSIYYSYVLFELKEYLYNVDQNELNDKIKNESYNRESILRKSLVRDYGLM